ncbi:hypothetical protein [Streptomyces natalensis]|uniref:hypothetical protein n=1 Tax=Streptomyces natalensis TaxID=68242 RepID=UPI00068DC0BA|nr:hypothetical protein [Streptomyces natalensis]
MTYTVGQMAATVVVTRTLGYRLPVKALLVGAAINATTHALIDRRKPLLWLAKRLGKGGYVDHCTVTRVAEDGTVYTEQSGPGTAVFELDRLCTKPWADRRLGVPLTRHHGNAAGQLGHCGAQGRQATAFPRCRLVSCYGRPVADHSGGLLLVLVGVPLLSAAGRWRTFHGCG